MRVAFARVGADNFAVDYARDRLAIKGFLTRVSGSNGLVKLHGRLSGTASVICDVCAGAFDCKVNEPVELLISNGIYRAPRDAELFDEPIMEMNDTIDLDEIFDSEFGAFECDYHRCPKCLNENDTLVDLEETQGE